MAGVRIPRNSKIHKNSPLPRYYQVVEKIREAIRVGGHKKGDRLPAERRLCQYYGVSRLTIRKALDALVAENLITKEWGKGIYVKKAVRDISSPGGRIGVTVLHGQEVTYHPATLAFLRGVSEILEKKHCDMHLVFVTPSLLLEGEFLRWVNSCGLAGLILAVQELSSGELRKIEKSGPRMIAVNRQCTGNWVNIDYRDASFHLTEHLLSLGHKRIGLVNGSAEFEISQQVLSGYRACLKEHGLAVQEKLIRYGEYDYRVGFDATRHLLEQTRLTAIICGDDCMASGAIEALREKGLTCPGDISVACLGDFPFSRFAAPPLTAVRIPIYEAGEAAAEHLIALLEGREEQSRIVLKGALVVRQSTAVRSPER